MRTPAGAECPHYYEDFHRGRSQQECRLILRNPRSLAWTPEICGKCTVPAIMRANGSDDLLLEVTVRKRFGVFTSVEVSAACLRHERVIDDPYLGCPVCRDELSSALPLG